MQFTFWGFTNEPFTTYRTIRTGHDIRTRPYRLQWLCLPIGYSHTLMCCFCSFLTSVHCSPITSYVLCHPLIKFPFCIHIFTSWVFISSLNQSEIKYFISSFSGYCIDFLKLVQTIQKVFSHLKWTKLQFSSIWTKTATSFSQTDSGCLVHNIHSSYLDKAALVKTG